MADPASSPACFLDRDSAERAAYSSVASRVATTATTSTS